MAVTMSSPASFVTAAEAISSTNPPASTQTAPDTSRRPSYRPSKPLAYAVRSHIAVYLEGSMYHEAFTFLTTLLTASTSVSTPSRPHPALVPPPTYLAMAATLAVHPSLTTRTLDTEKQRAADEALRYLRLVTRVVGPANGGFGEAFAFPGLMGGSSRRGRRRRDRGTETPDDDGDGAGDVGVRSRFAEGESVFVRVNDFWQVVGWAFNCAVLHQRRWERWRVWLEVVCEVLEADLAERVRNVQESTDKGLIPRPEDTLVQSLIVRYVEAAGQGRTAWRRVMRAVLADGSKKAVQEFGEVWEGETRGPKKVEEKKAGAREVDIEGDKWGDYDLTDEEDEVVKGVESNLRVGSLRNSARNSTRNSTRQPSEHSELSDFDEDQGEDHATRESSEAPLLGGLDSILLRWRIMALLTKVSELYPTALTHQSELFDVFTEALRPLPLDTFSTFLSTSPLTPMTQAALCTNLLFPLITTAPPNYNPLRLNQADLERFFLRAPANTYSFVDNAKVSLLLQTIVTQMFVSKQIRPTEAFGAAVEEGIRARKEKAIGDARRRGKGQEGEEKEARGVLDASAKMLMVVLEVIESAAGIKQDRPPLFDRESSESSLSSVPPRLSVPSQSSSLSSISSELGDDDDEDMLDEITLKVPGI